MAQIQRTITEPLPTRQVHLDFHTSEFIPGIGERFDKEQFQEALILGHLNQINIFAKGHHGWSYYPTQVGEIHPNLKFDLLGAEMEACHEIGVKCPFYFTVGWSAKDAEEHPEWLIRNEDGTIAVLNYDTQAAPSVRKPFYSWKCLDASVGTPYHKLIMKQVEEICKKYPDLDGFFFDIYHVAKANYNSYALERMKKEGIDISDPRAVECSHARALKAHMQELRELIARYHPEATVFFNSATHISDDPVFTERLYDMNTHAELEDLPTTWGGYNKLPLEAKYHLGQGTPVVAMSGKFHEAWGEFGGFKHPDAIKYEAAAMISYGASCNFGDQLHPSGEMDLETYRNIGKAYEYVKKIEEYGPGGIPVSKLGVWLSLDNAADHGLVNMLLEMHYDFIVANENNLEQLALLIIPGAQCLTKEQAKYINTWVEQGGKLIVFGEGALDVNEDEFLLNIGVDLFQESEYDFDYTVVEPVISTNLVTSPFLNYESGLWVRLTTGQSLGWIREPYFNRTYEHYSSHRETPYRLENSEYPAVVRSGNTIFFAHHLDKMYYVHGVRLYREMVKNAIDLLYQKPLLKVSSLPSSGRVSLLKQVNKDRYVVHLLYSPALLRGEVQVIEDFLPVPGVEIIVNVPEKVKNVYQVPAGGKLDFQKTEQGILVVIPTFTMHTGIVLEYE